VEGKEDYVAGKVKLSGTVGKEKYVIGNDDNVIYKADCVVGFLTQQYRLFSNYSASLQMDICYSDYTRIELLCLE
jgi:hypothetical protein